MTVYNKTKTEILAEYDLTKGYLKEDTIVEVIHHKKVEANEGKYHFVEYPNGGKDKVWDIYPTEEKLAYDEEVITNIKVYIPYTDEEVIAKQISVIRSRRETECFPIVNRGKLWYKQLSYEQEIELELWYNAWLNATETLTIPERPNWVDKKIINDTEVL